MKSPEKLSFKLLSKSILLVRQLLLIFIVGLKAPVLGPVFSVELQPSLCSLLYRLYRKPRNVSALHEVEFDTSQYIAGKLWFNPLPLKARNTHNGNRFDY